MKRFDAYTKPVDGISQQTVLGALVTVASICIVVLLIVSEFGVYIKKDVLSHMVADVTVGVEAVRLDFDVLFHNSACDGITFVQEVTRGTIHTHEPEKITKLDVGTSGCRVYGYIVTDKVGGNFRFGVEPIQVSPDSPEAAEMAKARADIQLFNPLQQGQPLLTAPDLTHTINHLMFLPAEGKAASEADIPDMEHPLNGQSSNVTAGTGLYQYAIQVVPTHYKTLKGDLSHANQYSVTEREIGFQQVQGGVSVSGQMFKDVFGLLFTYDFYPVRQKRISRNGNSYFLSSLPWLIFNCDSFVYQCMVMKTTASTPPPLPLIYLSLL